MCFCVIGYVTSYVGTSLRVGAAGMAKAGVAIYLLKSLLIWY